MIYIYVYKIVHIYIYDYFCYYYHLLLLLLLLLGWLTESLVVVVTSASVRRWIATVVRTAAAFGTTVPSMATLGAMAPGKPHWTWCLANEMSSDGLKGTKITANHSKPLDFM